ncbi:hypothetical protein DL93DRAFT_2071025 [Clavulina sp. PMI_390]|nr:hypothetical protein DL93DRAFT_2071025 [Clavulina sp. PMI_390]
MDNVQQEIVQAVELITSASTPEVQLAAINKFFAPDAGFNHPLCTVPRGPGSRNQVTGIYQWYREMSPTIDLKVESFAWDEANSVVFLNIVQKFQIWFSPFKSSPAHLVVRLTLARDPSTQKYHIVQQDDYYHPEDIAALMIPRLVPFIYVAKRAGTVASYVNAWVFQNVFGWWRPSVMTPGMKKAAE